jgi:hypothetical protein
VQEGNQCRGSCLSSQESVSYACSGNEVCCAPKTKNEGIPLWLWILIGIILVLIVIAVLLRDRIKVWYYKRKTGFRKEDESGKSVQGPGPTRPGFPPITRPGARPLVIPPRTASSLPRSFVPPQKFPPRFGANSKTQDTFNKLKDMTKE